MLGDYFWCWLLVDALLASRCFFFVLDNVSMLTCFPFHAKTGFTVSYAFRKNLLHSSLEQTVAKVLCFTGCLLDGNYRKQIQGATELA